MMRIYKAFEMFWLKNPVWMPFAVLFLLPVFLFAKPGMFGYIVGTHVDTFSSKYVKGTFELHSSDFTPYRFRTLSGQELSLACQAHERFVTCLDRRPAFASVVDLKFKPSIKSSFSEADGIIKSVSRGNTALYLDIGNVSHAKLNFLTKVFTYFLTIFMVVTYVVLLFMAVFIGIGLVISIKRIFAGFTTGKRRLINRYAKAASDS